jgi:hypothetical protein
MSRVLGILMLTFASLGLLFTIILAALGPGWLQAPHWLALELGVSATHLVAAVGACGYKPWARAMATVYAVLTVVVGILLLGATPGCLQPPPEAPAGHSPFMHGLDHMLTQGLLMLAAWLQVGLRLIWALLVLVLMNTRKP